MNALLTADQALIAREFRDFDLSTLPRDIPSHYRCDAWRNDACPMWVTADGAFALAIDYASPLDREFPADPRYSLHADDGVLFSTNDWSALLAAEGRLVQCEAKRKGAPA